MSLVEVARLSSPVLAAGIVAHVRLVAERTLALALLLVVVTTTSLSRCCPVETRTFTIPNLEKNDGIFSAA
jgi:hypothetical protein